MFQQSVQAHLIDDEWKPLVVQFIYYGLSGQSDGKNLPLSLCCCFSLLLKLAKDNGGDFNITCSSTPHTDATKPSN